MKFVEIDEGSRGILTCRGGCLMGTMSSSDAILLRDMSFRFVCSLMRRFPFFLFSFFIIPSSRHNPPKLVACGDTNTRNFTSVTPVPAGPARP